MMSFRFGRAVLPAFVLLLHGCGQMGKVNQGRAVAYDSENGIVTLIADSNYKDPADPRYDALPPVAVKIPADPKQMGIAPEPGKLTRLDSANDQVLIYDEAARNLKLITYALIEKSANVFPDDARVKGREFPVVDAEKKTVTVYSPRRMELVVFSVPAEYFVLPRDTWKSGDEVRYYYKDPRQALRMMNVTKTDLR